MCFLFRKKKIKKRTNINKNENGHGIWCEKGIMYKNGRWEIPDKYDTNLYKRNKGA